MATTLGVHNPLRYRGYVYDSETALYYLQSRYYDPELGRFINADALASTGQGLLGYNMFAYCNNNPVVFEDTNGYSLKPSTTRISDIAGRGAPHHGTISSDDYADYEKHNQSGTKLRNKIDDLRNSKVGEGVSAVNQIRSGVSNVKKGFGFLFIPVPSLADDLVGIGFITYGVLKAAGGITKVIIWMVKE